ncbi:MAG: ATP-binding cassette domain-containing protein [Bacteroidota bacterium]
MIELRNIYTIKSGKKIFEDLTWKINTGEHWVVSGANGSGKTSLLEILSSRHHAQKGEVYYDFITGVTWDEQFDQKRQFIQYIPTHSAQALFPKESDVYYQQRYYSLGDEIKHVKVRDVLKGDVHHFISLDVPQSFDLEPLLNREIKHLSNGQLKKVLILQRLLHHRPKLLLLDYPFEGLDRQSRRDFCDFIDFVVEAYSMQVIIADHGHELPKCIKHRLILEDLRIAGTETVSDDVTPRAITSQKHQQSSNSDVVVEIKDLKIQYGDTVILNDFNWTVNRGDRWALIGSNGSGKTTLFSIIFADHPLAYSQQVYLFGKRRGTGESIWQIKERINYMGPELMSFLDAGAMTQTAREYILKGSSNASKLDELVEFFKVSFIDQPIRQLSSGQLQLASLMRCFINDKEILLLDEPFQFLSPDVSDRVSEYLQRYLSDDTTLILITHYEEDLKRWTEKTMRV